MIGAPGIEVEIGPEIRKIIARGIPFAVFFAFLSLSLIPCRV